MSGQCDNTLHVLHTARKEWNRPPIQGPLPTPRHSHSGCSVGTTMYIFGGQVDDFYLDDVVAFDMRTSKKKRRGTGWTNCSGLISLVVLNTDNIH
jgi:hypothetical protein